MDADDLQQSTELVSAWCARSGNELVEVRGSVATVRRGRRPDPFAGLTPDQMPGTRLWFYTNFDCNLACDYCCARSSPQTPRRALGLDRVLQLATEARDAGVRELLLTGGEPFLLPDLDELVGACTAALPTTLLTNGMLGRGARLQRLQRMDPHRLVLQISLDSATPELHDRHRGPGSWARRRCNPIRPTRSPGCGRCWIRCTSTVPTRSSGRSRTVAWRRPAWNSPSSP